MSASASNGITLHQFSSSHYNEKARWVLTFKQVEHKRVGHLPGPHISAMKKLSGQSSTPVLDWHGKIIAGSNEIVTFVDAEVSEKPLFPEDPTARKEVVEWCQRLDNELGPAVRTLAWSGMIDHTGYVIRVFGRDQSLIKLFIYRLLFPLLRSVIGKANGVNPENIKKSEGITTRYLAEIDDATQTTGYLVGSEFTAADLTAAALLAPLSGLEHPDMKLPEPVVESFKIIINRYSEHPAIRWVKEQYRQHRAG